MQVKSEHDEQVAFVKWCEDRKLKLTAVPNNTYTKSWSQKRKNHAEGLRSGFSDLIVLISPEQSIDGLGYMLCIEMKKTKGGVQSANQKEWEKAINALDTPHIQYYLCKGCNAATSVLKHYLNESKHKTIAF